MSTPTRKPIPPEAFELALRIYQRHGAGCCHHVVLDDGNWDSAEFCLQWAREQGCEECIALGLIMVTLSETQRAKVARKTKDALPRTWMP